MQYAVVDLGSNTIRLSVYDTRPGGTFELLFSEKEMAGLAGCVEDGVLSQAGIHRACQALTHFQRLARLVGLERVHVFATASLRNIRNTEEALAVIRKACGLEVDVVPGDMEAELGYYGALRTLDLRDGAMFDIGGGSTELVEVRQGQILRAQSLPVGSLNLFSRYVRRVWPRREEIEQLEKAVKKALAQANLPEKKAETVCGVGGTARAVLKIANAWRGAAETERRIAPAELHRLRELLLRRDGQARRLILDACPDRLHTILPGIILMDAVCKALCGGELYVSRCGVREGYLCHRLLGI